MAMDIVQLFNQELNSLLEVKLPVSRQKMITLTRTAISDKAMKFYKHIVYSVEKFIKSCPEDYRVTGLFVIDAIVRQSKQLYQEKDVYGPRFLKNIVQIFVSLSKCQQKEKPMIQRVLQLWRKAGVFSEELIELLGEIIYSDNPEVVERARLLSNNNFYDANNKRRIASAMSDECSSDFNSSVHHPTSNCPNDTDHQSSSTNNQIHTLKRLIEQTKALSSSELVEGNEALMDRLTTILNELRHKAQEAIIAQEHSKKNLDLESIIDSDTLHQLQLTIMKLAAQAKEKSSKNSSPLHQADHRNSNSQNNESRLDDDNNSESSNGIRGLRPSTPNADDQTSQNPYQHQTPHRPQKQQQPNLHSNNLKNNHSSRSSVSSPNSFTNHRPLMSPVNSKSKKQYSISTPTEPGRTETEAPPPPPPPPYPPTSSPSSKVGPPPIPTHPPLPIEPPSETPQQIRRRRVRLNLPELKADHIGILSHTIFIGHLHKTLLEHRLQTLCEEIGEGIVVECNFIPPRGCAFITYESRLAAHKALLALDNACVDNRQVKVAWAPNKGVKDCPRVCEKFWSLQEGVTWLPYDYARQELNKNSFDSLLQGNGEFDHDTIPYDHELRSKKGGPIPDYPHQRNADLNNLSRKRPSSTSSNDYDAKKIPNNCSGGQNPQQQSPHQPSIHPQLPMMVSLSVPPPPLVVGQPPPPPLSQASNIHPSTSNQIMMGPYHSAPPGHIPSNRPIFTNAPPPPLPQGSFPRYPRMYGP